MPYGVDGKRSLVAKAAISKGSVRASFLPVLIDRHLRPEILHAGDPRFDDTLAYGIGPPKASCIALYWPETRSR
jgi:hypothetical protein